MNWRIRRLIRFKSVISDEAWWSSSSATCIFGRGTEHAILACGDPVFQRLYQPASEGLVAALLAATFLLSRAGAPGISLLCAIKMSCF